MKKLALVLLGATCIQLSASCTRKDPPLPVFDAGPTTSLTAPTNDGESIAKRSCLSCHEMDMLEQQRLTEAQWTKVVTKMQGWGAVIDVTEVPILTAWLARSFDLDAGAWAVRSAPRRDVLQPLVPSDDGKYADGKAENGKKLFEDRCSGCHAPSGRGHLGVNLVDRPFLYRADEFAATIRAGRGRMPPAKIADGEVADLLAHLRTLR